MRKNVPYTFILGKVKAQAAESELTEPSVYPIHDDGGIWAVMLWKISRAFAGFSIASVFFIGNHSVLWGGVDQGGGSLRWCVYIGSLHTMNKDRVQSSEDMSLSTRDMVGMLLGGHTFGLER